MADLEVIAVVERIRSRELPLPALFGIVLLLAGTMDTKGDVLDKS
jgi:hypothetical protein